eukprot:jgi/Phyca11/16063/fgenesh1_pg.PHYCAscaffold_17_\
MATKIGERLKELAAFLAHAHAVSSVEEVVGHLQTDITDGMARSRASAQQCTILLFQSEEPPSLLHFLSASADFADDARKREVSAARGLVLELLGFFFKTYGAHRSLAKQHVVDAYKACQQIARTDPFNRVKGHALTVVVNTAKGQMLEVIGYLVESFPKEVNEQVAVLLERYKRDDTLRKKIYSYVFTVFATTVSGNLSRYQVTSSSEIFLVKHAEMFQQEIGSNGQAWFSYMKFCCLSENKTFVKERRDVPLDEGYVQILGDVLCHLMTQENR